MECDGKLCIQFANHVGLLLSVVIYEFFMKFELILNKEIFFLFCCVAYYQLVYIFVETKTDYGETKAYIVETRRKSRRVFQIDTRPLPDY